MLPKPERTRKQERAKEKREDAKVQHKARLLVFMEDERCRFPYEATVEHPCAGEDELMHMGSRTKAATRNREPSFRHDPLYLLRGCAEHHRGTYSYDGNLGGKGFVVEPMTDKMYRGPCRFIDVESGTLIGIN